MATIFLSYSRADHDLAMALTSALKAAGHIVLWDIDRIRTGDLLEDRIRACIDLADYLVALITEQSVDSDWVEREVKMAIAREGAGKQRMVLPVVEQGVVIPAYFGERAVVRFDCAAEIGKIPAQLKEALRDRPLYDESTPGVHLRRARLDALARVTYARELWEGLRHRSRTPRLDGWWAWDDHEWTVGMYEGLIGASRYVLRCSQVVGWDRTDDQEQLWFFSVLSFIYIADLTLSVPPEYAHLNNITLDQLLSEELEHGPPTRLRRELVLCCPPTDSVDYQLGWKQLLVWLHGQVQNDQDNGVHRGIEDYLDRVRQFIWESVKRYEDRFDPATGKFWRLVEATLGAIAQGQLEGFRQTQPEVVGWFLETFGLWEWTCDDVRDTYTSVQSKLIELRGRFLYVGKESPERGLGLEVELLSDE